jgi:hypothetical protein
VLPSEYKKRGRRRRRVKENQWGVFFSLLVKFKTRLFFHYYSNVFEELKKIKDQPEPFFSSFFLKFSFSPKEKK